MKTPEYLPDENLDDEGSSGRDEDDELGLGCGVRLEGPPSKGDDFDEDSNELKSDQIAILTYVINNVTGKIC